MFRQIKPTYSRELNLFKPSSSSQDTQNEVSNCLHIIWIGGVLRSCHVDRIRKWKEINPGYAINIWVDSIWSSAIESQLTDSSIIINDISTLSLSPCLSNWVEELVKPGATPSHYSAASDIYRFAIIHKIGGWYVDTDVIPFDLASIPINKELQFHIHATRKGNFIAELSPDCFASKPNSLLTQKAFECLEALGSEANQAKFNQLLRSGIASERLTTTFITTGFAFRAALGRILINEDPFIEVHTDEDGKIHDLMLFDSIASEHHSYFEQSWIYSEQVGSELIPLPGIKLDDKYLKITTEGGVNNLPASVRDILYSVVAPSYKQVTFSKIQLEAEPSTLSM